MTLVEAVDGEGMSDEARLHMTGAGYEELRTLLTAPLRSGAAELNKLVVALKFRFLHLLERDEQIAQAEFLMDACENELARLDPLRLHHAEDKGFVVQWLDHEIAQLEARLEWLDAFRSAIVA